MKNVNLVGSSQKKKNFEQLENYADNNNNTQITLLNWPADTYLSFKNSFFKQRKKRKRKKKEKQQIMLKFNINFNIYVHFNELQLVWTSSNCNFFTKAGFHHYSGKL